MTEKLNETFYAIRHVPTGQYLPVGAGSTWWEPKPHQVNRNEPIRLFPTIRGAEACVRTWLRGRHRLTPHYAGPLSCSPSEWEPEMQIDPVPSRRAEDIEIVTIALIGVAAYNFGEKISAKD